MKEQTAPELWIRAQRRKHEESEALRLSVLSQMDRALGTLIRKYRWTECYLFGSILSPGRFHEDSDVDLAVGGLARHDLYRFVGDVSSILERNVDVVVLEESRLAESIRRKGKPWSPRNP